MSHRDRQQVGSDTLPVVYLLVVEVCPMEVERRGKILRCSRVGEVQSLLRCHSHEYLYQREDAMREDTLVGILLDLVDSLSHIHTASLQLDMDNRHTIDEQHHIATASSAQWVLCLELWLTHNLINTLSGTHLLGIENG